MRLQEILARSLLDLAVAAVWTCWPRLSAWWHRPVLRLDRSCVQPVRPRRERRLETGVVAVLVSRPAMAERVRRALAGRTRLCFTSTWDELQQVVTRVSPSAVFVDPVADRAGDPERHLARISGDWGVPVILYTTLTCESAASVLRLAGCRIRHVIFHGHDDEVRRLVAACEWGPSGPPLRAA